MGKIRLACRFCDRGDYDHVDQIPSDWHLVDEVQSYEASLQQVDPARIDQSVLDWYTHLGVCPSCYGAEIESAVAS